MCPAEAGGSYVDRFGCEDEDADGTSDTNDAFLGEPTQWTDSDGDGYGDNADGVTPDACILTVGSSTVDVYGCPDQDGDGVSDSNDLWPDDATQWYDTDGDGYGDETTGTDGDTCPNEFGTSTANNVYGCPDGDADGWADQIDVFPEQRSQHADSDGDGFGDNATLGAFKPDHWPFDKDRNAAEASIECDVSSIDVDIATNGRFDFMCAVTTTMMSPFVAEVSWQTLSGVQSESSFRQLIFSATSGDTQQVRFAGQALEAGTYDLVISAHEPGADAPMDLAVVVIKAVDSNAPVSTQDETSGSLMDTLVDNTMLQAALAGLVLFVLMGTLMIRGQSKRIRADERRMMRAAELRQNRGIVERPRTKPAEAKPAPQTSRSGSMFDEFRRNR